MRINMKTNTSMRFVTATALALVCAGCSSSSDKPSADKPSTDSKVLRVEDAAAASVTATVQAIDYGTREMTLKPTDGEPVTLTVDKRVQRLNDIHVGDQVKADYYVSLARELRAPTAEEKENPVMAVAGAARAPEGTEPAAGALRAIRIVTTVKAIDLPKQSVTLELPGGKSTTVRAQSVDNLKKLKVGDNIIVTYTEGLAVSVEKVAPAK
jgi:hypothetical protein